VSKRILVVGSTALDTVETHAGKVEDALGGSAFFFSAAASLLAPVGLVGVVGGDFPHDRIRFLVERGVDLSGLETVPQGLTFRWGGRYHENLNDRTTLFTHLNVFEHFDPRIPEAQRNAPVLFLANIQPSLQLKVLDQLTGPERVITDTMNLWIDLARPELLEVIRRTHILIVNDQEARMLTGHTNPLEGAFALRRLGPDTVIVKKGEHGALMVDPDGDLFSMPAWPLARVVDPTGAGDTFAGGFVGSLARDGAWGRAELCRAMAWGSAMASFCVEDFSVDRLVTLDHTQARQRFDGFRGLTTIPA
jgi:sugar/nucleoside kinase (ribokinase family)